MNIIGVANIWRNGEVGCATPGRQTRNATLRCYVSLAWALNRYLSGCQWARVCVRLFSMFTRPVSRGRSFRCSHRRVCAPPERARWNCRSPSREPRKLKADLTATRTTAPLYLPAWRATPVRHALEDYILLLESRRLFISAFSTPPSEPLQPR